MRKKILQNLLAVSLCGIVVTTVALYVIQTQMAYSKADETFSIILDEVEKAIGRNDERIRELTDVLKEDYICRARAFADIVALDPDIINDQERLLELKDRLDVDEMHVTDENGVLRWGTNPEYFGLNFVATEQTLPFMPILENLEMEYAQDAMPNGSYGVSMQYIGVARKDKKGIIQIGLVPSRLERALNDTTIDKVLGNILIGSKGYLIAVDTETNLISYHPDKELIGTPPPNSKYKGLLKVDGEMKYFDSKQMGDKTVMVVMPASEVFSDRIFYTVIFSIFMVLVFGIFCAVVNTYMSRRIVRGISNTVSTLERISDGDLDVEANVRTNEEFIKLSDGINNMLFSINTKIAHIEQQNETIMSSIEYSSKIQTNLLPLDSAMEKAFSDYSVIWKPRDIVGGDIYWMKQFESGTVLCVADCTGHGTPGALLTMLVVSEFESAVKPKNCHDTAEIIWQLEQRLVDVLNVKSDGRKEGANDIQDGCDLAVLFIANDGNITLSAGHTNVYVCDGKKVKRIRGQKLYIGEGKISGKDDIETLIIPANPDNKIYIASDGLSDQPGWETDEPFGYRTLGEIVLANHGKPLSEITDIVWSAFEEHRGNTQRVDDFELVAFKP